MKINGTRLLPVSRAVTWASLFDADLIRESIVGCETLDWKSDHELEGKMTFKIGAVRAKFNIFLTITDIIKEDSYSVEIRSKAGVLGFASGSAHVSLIDADEGCEMVYDAVVKIGGKIAQLGSRLMNSMAKKKIDDFFDAFVEGIEKRAAD